MRIRVVIVLAAAIIALTGGSLKALVSPAIAQASQGRWLWVSYASPPPARGESGTRRGAITISRSTGPSFILEAKANAEEGSLNGTHQCPALIVRYAEALGYGGGPLGNGHEVARAFANASGGGFTFEVNGESTSSPVVGAVLSIAGQDVEGRLFAGGYGHVGVVQAASFAPNATAGFVTLFDQNWPGAAWKQINFVKRDGTWFGTMENNPARGPRQVINVVGWANPVTGPSRFAPPGAEPVESTASFHTDPRGRFRGRTRLPVGAVVVPDRDGCGREARRSVQTITTRSATCSGHFEFAGETYLLFVNWNRSAQTPGAMRLVRAGVSPRDLGDIAGVNGGFLLAVVVGGATLEVLSVVPEDANSGAADHPYLRYRLVGEQSNARLELLPDNPFPPGQSPLERNYLAVTGTAMPPRSPVLTRAADTVPSEQQPADNATFQLAFPLRCTSAACDTRYSSGAYTAGLMTSILDHSMKLGSNGAWPYGGARTQGSDGIIVAADGSRFQGAPKPGDATCIGGQFAPRTAIPDFHALHDPGACQAGFVSYDEHPGYDYRAAVGTPVYAAAAGQVLDLSSGRCVLNNMAGTCDDWGMVGIDHGNGYVTQYAHLSRIDVSAGAVIAAGELLGLSGQEAPSSLAPHLHFEVLYKVGNEYLIVDPYGWSGPGNSPLYSASRTPRGVLWAQVPARPTQPAAPETDQYLSADIVEVITTGPARVRDRPTATGSAIIDTLPEGMTVSGRWVRGVDPSARWLRLERSVVDDAAGDPGGFVWDGNLRMANGEWGPGIVPRLPDSANLGGDCHSQEGPELIRCLRRSGVRGEALEFAEALAATEAPGQYAEEFLELGKVDVATIVVHGASSHYSPVLINGTPSIIGIPSIIEMHDIDNPLLADTVSQAFMRRMPNAFSRTLSIIGHRKLDDGGQRFVLNVALADGCMACDLVGSKVAFIDVDATGKIKHVIVLSIFDHRYEVEGADSEDPRDPAFQARVRNALQNNVQLLQYELAAHGYDPGPFDGRLSAYTDAALREFERDQCLPVVGLVRGRPSQAAISALSSADQFVTPCPGGVRAAGDAASVAVARAVSDAIGTMNSDELVGTWELIERRCCGEVELNNDPWVPVNARERTRVTFRSDGTFESSNPRNRNGRWSSVIEEFENYQIVSEWMGYSVSVQIDSNLMTVTHTPTSSFNAYQEKWRRVEVATPGPVVDAGPARNRRAASIRLVAAPAGSPLRAAILGALRPQVEQDLGEPVRFVVSGLRTNGTYAHVSFTLVRPNGSEIVDTVPGGRAQAYGSALLSRVGGIWRVDHLSLGGGDVWECEHAENYPTGLMPPDYSC